MELVTLEEQHFKTACQKLAEKVQHMQFQPDIIIGIHSAGIYVADEVAKNYPRAKVYYIRPLDNKPSSRKVLKAIFRMLPEWMLKKLREFKETGRSTKKHTLSRKFDMPDEVRHLGKQKVLLVDDSVDGGSTLGSAARRLLSHNPDITLFTATIAVTRRCAICTPDVSLYKPGTLVRYPWSIDFKPKHKYPTPKF